MRITSLLAALTTAACVGSCIQKPYSLQAPLKTPSYIVRDENHSIEIELPHRGETYTIPRSTYELIVGNISPEEWPIVREINDLHIPLALVDSNHNYRINLWEVGKALVHDDVRTELKDFAKKYVSNKFTN